MKTIVSLLASLSLRVPWVVVIVTIALTGLFGALAGQVVLATGNEGFAPEGAEIAAMDRIGEKFGEESSETTVQIVLMSDGGDALTVEALESIRATVQVIGQSDLGPHIAERPERPGVVHYLLGVEQIMESQEIPIEAMTDEMVKDFFATSIDPELGSPEDASFLARLVSQDFDPATVSASGGMVLAFVNTFGGDTEEAFNRQMEAERDMAESLTAIDSDLLIQPFSFILLLSGFDDFTDEVSRLFMVAFLVILVLLLFVYWLPPGGVGTWRASTRRTTVDTLITLLTIVMAVGWMQGIGYLLERVGVITAFSAVTQIVPILLIALGIDYAIHLTSRYREEVGRGSSVDRSMNSAVTTVGVSLVLATVTTVIGFLTNVFNPVPALRDFGILAAVGILVAFVLMLTFVPALRILADRRAERNGTLPVGSLAGHGNRVIPRLMQRLAVVALRIPVLTLVIAIALGAAGFYGFTQLETRFSFTDFLPEDSPYVETMAILEAEFGGGFGEQTQVLMETAPEARINASAHNALVMANQGLADVPDVSTVVTAFGPAPNALSPVGLLGQVLMLDDELVPPEVLEAAGDVGLEPDLTVPDDADVSILYRAMVDHLPDASRVIHFDGTELNALLWDITTTAGEDVEALRSGLDSLFQPVRATGVSAIATSNNIVGDVVVQELTGSQSRSLLITVLVSGLVLVVSFTIESRRPFLGVITILPVALVVAWTYGAMYLAGIPFGPVTATLAALAIGIGVPFTIHIARRFQEDRVTHPTVEMAMHSTMRHTGGALAGTGMTTIAGFGVLITASLVPFRQMGQVTAFAIALCLLAAVLVLPSLLALWDRYHRNNGDILVPAADKLASSPPDGEV